MKEILKLKKNLDKPLSNVIKEMLIFAPNTTEIRDWQNKIVWKKGSWVNNDYLCNCKILQVWKW